MERYVFEYEFRRKNMAIEELKQIADQLDERLKLKRKPSPALVDAIALVRGEYAVAQHKSDKLVPSKTNGNDRPRTCSELFGG